MLRLLRAGVGRNELWHSPTVFACLVSMAAFWNTVSILPHHSQTRKFIGKPSLSGQFVYSFFLALVTDSWKTTWPKLFQWDSIIRFYHLCPLRKRSSTIIGLGCYTERYKNPDLLELTLPLQGRVILKMGLKRRKNSQEMERVGFDELIWAPQSSHAFS